jgi:hypothetical protein
LEERRGEGRGEARGHSIDIFIKKSSRYTLTKVLKKLFYS